MRIGFDLLYLVPGVSGGVETYAVELVRTLGWLYPEHQYVAFLNGSPGTERLLTPTRANVTVVRLSVLGSGRAGRYFLEQAVLPWYVRAERIDLLHCPSYTGPLLCPCPWVVTIHDVNFRDPSVTMAKLRRAVLGAFCLSSARAAAHVITVSEFSKRQIVDVMRIANSKITVVHQGPGQIAGHVCGAPLVRPDDLPPQYITAFAGGENPHKNTLRLVNAFGALPRNRPEKLVLLGRPPQSILAHPLVLDGRVLLLGHRPQASDALSIIAHALLHVVPSTYEGFGMPLLEAQALGVPVACSAIAALREIAGDSAAFFDPFSEASIANTILAVLSDPDRLSRLAQLGRDNARRYSWAGTARQTMAVYLRILGIAAQRADPPHVGAALL